MLFFPDISDQNVTWVNCLRLTLPEEQSITTVSHLHIL